MMAKDKLRHAIIGCGGMAGGHINACKDLKQRGLDIFDLVAVCDVDEIRASGFAQRVEEFQDGLKPKVYTDYRKMLEKEQIDSADICTDHRTHSIIAVECLKAGAHAMCEKPMGITVKACQQMIDVAKEHGKIVAVAENYRRGLGARAVKLALENGVIGAPQLYLQGGVGSRDDNITTVWRHHKLDAGDGTILDNGVHDSDLMYYWLGEVDEVYGVAFSFAPEKYRRDDKGNIIERTYNDVHDGGFAIFQFANGTIGQWSPAYWCGHGEGSHFGIWLYGSKGVIKGGEAILDDGSRINMEKYFDENANDELKEKYFPHGITDGVTQEVYDFMNCILTGGTPETDGVMGLKAVAIAYSLIESSCLGQPVKVKDVESGKIDTWQSEINESLGL